MPSDDEQRHQFCSHGPGLCCHLDPVSVEFLQGHSDCTSPLSHMEWLLDRLAASQAREAASSADISTLVAAIESALEDFDRRDELSAIDTLKTALTRRESAVKL